MSVSYAQWKYIQKCNLFFRTTKGEGDWIQLSTSFAKPNPDHNARLWLDEDVTIFQWHTVQLQQKGASESSYRFEVRYKADKLDSRLDMVNVLQEDRSEIQMAYIYLNLKPGIDPVTRAYLKAGQPFSMPNFSGPDAFPLARTYRSFAEIKIEIKTPARTKHWDLERIRTCLNGQRGHKRKTDDSAFIVSKRRATAAEGAEDRQELRPLSSSPYAHPDLDEEEELESVRGAPDGNRHVALDYNPPSSPPPVNDRTHAWEYRAVRMKPKPLRNEHSMQTRTGSVSVLVVEDGPECWGFSRQTCPSMIPRCPEGSWDGLDFSIISHATSQPGNEQWLITEWSDGAFRPLRLEVARVRCLEKLLNFYERFVFGEKSAMIVAYVEENQ